MDVETDPAERDELWGRVTALAEKVIDLHDDYPDEWKTFVAGIATAGLMADVIASTLPLPPEEKIALLSETNPDRTPAARRRPPRARGHDRRDPARPVATSRKPSRWTRGGASGCCGGACARSSRRSARATPESARSKSCARRSRRPTSRKTPLSQAERELKRLAALPQHAPDRHLIRTYIEWMAELPWSKETEDKLDLPTARDGARRRPPRPREGQGTHPRVPRRAQARARRQEPDPLLRRPARRRQDVARALDRAGHGAQLRPRVARRRARRGRDPRPPAHLRRRHAGSDRAEPAPGGLAQPRLPARRDRQARRRLPRRSVVGAARGARSRAEPRLQRPLHRDPLRPLARDVHRDGQHPVDDSARAARPHGGDRAARLHRERQEGHREAPPRARSSSRITVLSPEHVDGHRRGDREGGSANSPAKPAFATSTGRSRRSCARSRAASRPSGPETADRRRHRFRRAKRSARRRTSPRPPNGPPCRASSSDSPTPTTAATSSSSRPR